MNLQDSYLNAEAKQWLVDLRSGKYVQGKAILRRTEIDEVLGTKTFSHCCLGVYAETKKAFVGDCKLKNHDPFILGGLLSKDSILANGYLSAELVKKLGLKSERADVIPRSLIGSGWPRQNFKFKGLSYRNLTLLNDCRKATFEEIADLIEQRPYLFFYPVWFQNLGGSENA